MFENWLNISDFIFRILAYSSKFNPKEIPCLVTSGWSVTRKTEEPTENSKTRTEPKPKITDFSKTEPNRNRIQKPRLTEKGHFWKFWVKSGRKSEKILRFRLVLLKKHSNPKKFLQKCCKLSFKHLLALLKKCRILSQFLSTNADG